MSHVSQLFAQFAWMKIVGLQKEKEEECDKFSEDRYSREYVCWWISVWRTLSCWKVSDFQEDVHKNELILQKLLVFTTF